MEYVRPQYTRSEVNKAGDILIAEKGDTSKNNVLWALAVFTNWRASHSYPINTFQATLRSKLRKVCRNAVVAQRLKREVSIIHKLKRIDKMRLARMQDIGGLRAIVNSIAEVRRLEQLYLKSNKFDHKLTSHKDYINNPKNDGYRSVHLAYQYFGKKVSDYDKLSVEIQIRTKLQHAWATAVETAGTFLRQQLKSGEGEDAWKEFFRLSSAAISVIEKTSAVPGFENYEGKEIAFKLSKIEQELNALSKLKGFSVAADNIKTDQGQKLTNKRRGDYYLVVLDVSRRVVQIKPYMRYQLEEANKAYSEIEEKTKRGEPIEAVFVSVGSVGNLKKAYPNYFLDTHEFVKQISQIINSA